MYDLSSYRFQNVIIIRKKSTDPLKCIGKTIFRIGTCSTSSKILNRNETIRKRSFQINHIKCVQFHLSLTTIFSLQAPTKFDSINQAEWKTHLVFRCNIFFLMVLELPVYGLFVLYVFFFFLNAWFQCLMYLWIS